MQMKIDQTEWYDNCAIELTSFSGFVPFDISNHPWVIMRVKLNEAEYQPDNGSANVFHDSVNISIRIMDDNGDDISQGQSKYLPVDSNYHRMVFDYSALSGSGDPAKFAKLLVTPIFKPGQYKDLKLLIDYIKIGDTIFDDPTLDSITVDTFALDPVFDPETHNYGITLPEGTTNAPVIDYVVADPDAQVNYTAVTDVNSAAAAERTATISVTSQDGSGTIDYTILFDVTTPPDTTTEMITRNVQNVQLYPNPATNYLFVCNALKYSSLEIFDLGGKQMLVSELEGTKRKKISLGGISGGIYFVRISGNESTEIHKLVIH